MMHTSSCWPFRRSPPGSLIIIVVIINVINMAVLCSSLAAVPHAVRDPLDPAWPCR